MTPTDIRLVQSSFARLGDRAPEMAAAFYIELFRLKPHLRLMFPHDLMDQRRKLVETLALVVAGLSNPATILPVVRALGARHMTYRVEPEHYSFVGEALLHALERTLGDAFTEETEAAWTSCYMDLAGEMLAAA